MNSSLKYLSLFSSVRVPLLPCTLVFLKILISRFFLFLGKLVSYAKITSLIKRKERQREERGREEYEAVDIIGQPDDHNLLGFKYRAGLSNCEKVL